MIHTRKHGVHLILAGATLAATLTAQDALAQARLEQVTDDSWRFSAGLGVFSRPKYPGSGDTQVVAVPLVTANFGRYFIGGTPGAGFPFGVGFNLIQDDNWRFGVALGGELTKPRKATDAPILNGWGDISETALGSVFAAYSLDWLTVRGFLVSDIGGNDQGTRFALDLEGKYQLSERLTLSAGPGLTWANGKYTQTFFGISARQSLIAGIPPYSAGSGLNTVRFSVGAQYQLSPQWSLGASVTAAWLQGDAENSPITEDKSQNTYGIFASYRF
ncbi:MipA/OmpV family protein [Variovorax sp. J22P240]|uniref:MipA/OmpV family protein n=1 Tax=unclassified Variovorax TaxID=663243 RepID=UPI002575844B|nr:MULTISPECIES: MipA/OmpV family protein [unclassified Variovorax]MDM0002281.1 MipA/OmpV family protein [Variovorax sp. J22P240]MDM0047786.1 MipA/OmpV family protein [Variovorax sp. J22R115]